MTDQWLETLPKEIVKGIEGNFLDSYAIALEGFRRGLKLTWHAKDDENFAEMETWSVDQPGQLFSLSDEQGNKRYFFRTRSDLISNEAVQIGKDKHRTREVLEANNVATPKGMFFQANMDTEEIISSAKELGFPLVVKPFDGSFGRGVVTHIKDEAELTEAISYVRTDLGFKDLILENHVSGDEFRLYVVNKRVIAAIKRDPAHVTGNGIQSIKELIDQKNEERKANPRLVNCLIKMDQEIEKKLAETNLNLEFIPAKNKKVYLRNQSNISLGGDSMDVLDDLPESVKSLAIQAIDSIPSLYHSGVDIMFDLDAAEVEPKVIEINPTAQIGSLLFPMSGIGRDVPAAILDFYFPESSKEVSSRNKIYFNFFDALKLLQEKNATRAVVPALTASYDHMENWKIASHPGSLEFQQRLKTAVIDHQLIGTIVETHDSYMRLFLLGESNRMQHLQEMLVEKYVDVKIETTKATEIDGNLSFGFTINQDRLQLLQKLQQERAKLATFESKKSKVEKQYQDMLNSRLWKLTAPIRKIGSLKKRILK
ncbi:ATP-grasp domain-containing protein [Halalkalibacillus halophilus]|uniref:ATP-grasp domain-containing protein n=1 Tax=Halalkalibacillus halophilus TaxID=392827 RepID=UPI0004203F8F|nr:ATP-grasp domain-containing protein [Halalkalibacillus halophilus]